MYLETWKVTEIETRQDVNNLVNEFYRRIRKDDLLGPIFNASIPEDNWPAHLEKLTDFWETNLLGKPMFKGSPTQAHLRMDQKQNHKIDQLHFHHWLEIWFETLDDMFIGEAVERAKAGARRMATGQFIMLYQHRNRQGSDF